MQTVDLFAGADIYIDVEAIGSELAVDTDPTALAKTWIPSASCACAAY